MRYDPFVVVESIINPLEFLPTYSTQSIKLRDAIKEYEANKWKVIGQKVGKPAKVGCTRVHMGLVHSISDSHDILFCSQACEQYAKEHFKNL
jgi:ferredoxin-fold anticodon binding domain-containing protein